MGIHYDYKSKRGERAMLKEAKRKARLAQRKAKRLMSSEPEPVVKEEIKTHIRVIGKYFINSPAKPGQNINGKKAARVVAVDDIIGRAIFFEALA